MSSSGVLGRGREAEHSSLVEVPCPYCVWGRGDELQEEETKETILIVTLFHVSPYRISVSAA